MPESPGAPFRPAKLGVVPIFEALRQADVDADGLAVLTGALVIIPRRALPALRAAALRLRLAGDAIRAHDIAACPDHLRLDPAGAPAGALLRLVTALFMAGDIRILVGTEALLGEGWDAPALNSLVLASNTASFMLSNQIRGRALRVDPGDLAKVANIWHLATLEPDDGTALSRTADFVNWGYRNDGGEGVHSDADLLHRRFRSFEGIANADALVIESGLGRLGLDPTPGFAIANRETFAIAADRSRIAARWQTALMQSDPRARVRETAAAARAPQRLSVRDTLQALAVTALTSGAFAAANEIREIGATSTPGSLGMALAGAATLASLPGLARAARLAWRNGTLEGSLAAVGEAVLLGLNHAGIVSDAEAAMGRFSVRAGLDGRRDIVLTGVSRSTERQVMQAIAELLGPVQNPRYLLVRTSWLGLKRRSDYHAVPSAIGARKEAATMFAQLWAQRIGSSRLVFTRTPAGRRLLLRARAQSLAAGFQRAVDRRSVWL